MSTTISTATTLLLAYHLAVADNRNPMAAVTRTAARLVSTPGLDPTLQEGYRLLCKSARNVPAKDKQAFITRLHNAIMVEVTA